MVAVMDVGGVSNCTLGDVKAVQHLTEVFTVLDSVPCIDTAPLIPIHQRIPF